MNHQFAVPQFRVKMDMVPGMVTYFWFTPTRTGTFDVLSVPIGLLSRDDPFFEGLDLVGVSTDMNELRKVVDTAGIDLEDL